MKILNLGCGVKTSERTINIDWSVYLRIKSSKLLSLAAKPFMTPHRRKRLAGVVDENVIVHNLAKGIPFEDSSVDAVYHCHLFEHLDRDVAVRFLKEAHRVLKPGGIHRIVIPDFEALTRRYLAHLDEASGDQKSAAEHDEFIGSIIEQSVRREAAGTLHHSPLWRRLENFVFGDARGRGETHQWMYDRVSLSQKMIECGYGNPRICDFQTSGIEGWNEIGLDVEDDDPTRPYREMSLYLEAEKL